MDIFSKDQLSRLSHNVAHDLKAPLRKIRQFSELLELDYSDALTGDGELYLEALKESSSQISDLVDSLLNYVRYLTDRYEFGAVDLNEVVEEQRLKFGPDVKITATELPTIKASPELMGVLFSNLLSNAVRFVKADTNPIIKISSRALQDGDAIYLEDNGIGISGAGSEKIFEPLIRLHAKSEFEGSGMGLAQCKVICDLHGWNIAHFGNETGGTSFEIKLFRAV